VSASTASLAFPTTLPQLLDRAIATMGSAPFIGVRTSTVREQSLTFEAYRKLAAEIAELATWQSRHSQSEHS
jgi:hypothetical protein